MGNEDVPSMKQAAGAERRKAYYAWHKMRSRCLNKKDEAYTRYGGRGITVCAEWENFETFLRDMGTPPRLGRGTSLDRRNNAGNYEPGNCRWTDVKTQQNNTRYNVNITIGGNTQSVSRWSDRTGVDRHTIFKRIARGITGKALIAKPDPRYQRYARMLV
jgi:hypothetical protein